MPKVTDDREISWLLKNLLKAGLVYERKVLSMGNSAYMRVDKSLSGRNFRVILIPLDSPTTIRKDSPNTEDFKNYEDSKWKKDMEDEIHRLQLMVNRLLASQTKPEEKKEIMPADRFKIQT